MTYYAIIGIMSYANYDIGNMTIMIWVSKAPSGPQHSYPLLKNYLCKIVKVDDTNTALSYFLCIKYATGGGGGGTLNELRMSQFVCVCYHNPREWDTC